MKRKRPTSTRPPGKSSIDRVSEYMTSPIQFIEASDTIQAAALKMRKLRVGSLLVWDRGGYAGIVTRTDLVNRVIAESLDPVTGKVREVMTSPVIYVEANSTLEEADQIMGKHRLGHLPVKEGDRVLGMASVRNLMLYFLEAQSDISERRGYVRLPFTALVRYRDSEEREYHSLTYDINGGGIFIQTEKPFPVGSKIEIEMTLPNDGKVIKSKGIVSWLKNTPREVMRAKGEIVYVKRQLQKVVVHPGGMGVRFTQISEGDKVAVMEFVSEISRRIESAQDAV